MPFGIKVGKEKHSEYGGGEQSDEDQKMADLQEVPAEKTAAPESSSNLETEHEMIKAYKEYLVPKVLETNTVQVEPLETVSSEEGYELPIVMDASSSIPPTPTVFNDNLDKEQDRLEIEPGALLEPPASAQNINRFNDSVMPVSASKFTDSFG